MNLRSLFTAVSALAVSAVLSLPCTALGQDYLEDFTTNQTVLFEFLAYTGNSSFSPAGLVVDVPASADSFGGLGIAPTMTVDLTGVSALEVTARLEANNASDLILSIREAGVGGALGEFFSYLVPASSFNSTGFTTVSIDPTTGLAGSLPFIGDFTNGVLDGLLDNTSIQSPFGGTSAQNITVQSVNYVLPNTAVPEPTSLVLLLGACPILIGRRRRKI